MDSQTCAQDSIRDDDLITLEMACELYFRGPITPNSLKTEHRRGNLTFYKFGGKVFTTPAAIREMKEKCRVQKSPQGSGSEKKKTAGSGSSSTGQNRSAQAALNQTLNKLKSDSGITKPKSTNQPTASIHKLSPSQTR